MGIPKRRPVPNKRCSTVEDAIVSAIQGGATTEHACLQHGIHPVTFQRWRRCRQFETSDRDDRCWNCRECSLQQKVDCALETYKSVLLRRISDATDRDGNPIWQASAWILERRFKDEYSLRTVIDNRHEVDIGSTNAQSLVAAILKSVNTL